jgi:hypothetical protein
MFLVQKVRIRSNKDKFNKYLIKFKATVSKVNYNQTFLSVGKNCEQTIKKNVINIQ